MTTATAPTRRTLEATTVVTDAGKVSVPRWVTDLDSFRRWLDTDEVPEKAKTWFFNGKVWIDMSKEQLDTHAGVKGEIHRVLANEVKAAKSGPLYPDGVLLTNRAANLSGKPDVLFVSNEAASSGRVRRIPGKEGGFVELEGTPDMVLEVVSAARRRRTARRSGRRTGRPASPSTGWWTPAARTWSSRFSSAGRRGTRRRAGRPGG